MFNKLKSLFSGSKPVAAPQEHIFTDAEATVIKLAHDPIHMQIMLANSMRDGKISLENQITPWVIGYLCGFLDQVTQRVEKKQHAEYETMKLFLDYHFTPDLHQKMWACYIGATSLSNKKDSPLYPVYEDFLNGARAGFGFMLDDSEGGTDLPELAKKLMELKGVNI